MDDILETLKGAFTVFMYTFGFVFGLGVAIAAIKLVAKAVS